MSIVGTGIDIVVVEELSRLIKGSAGRFEARCFTLNESHAAGTGSNRVRLLAETFAAKEAVLKALGTGWSQGVSWTDIEVLWSPKEEPSVKLYKEANEIASRLGINEWKVCISRSSSYAIASVIALSCPEEKE